MDFTSFFNYENPDREPTAFTILKVVGADVASVGRFDPAVEGDQVIVQEDAADYKYRKLVVDRGGRLAGAIHVGHPALTSGVTGAVKAQRDVSGELASLRQGRGLVRARRRLSANPAPNSASYCATLRPQRPSASRQAT